ENVEARLPHKCEVCGKRSSSRWHLSYHMQIHLPPTDARRRFECDTCGKILASAAILRKHNKTHLEYISLFALQIFDTSNCNLLMAPFQRSQRTNLQNDNEDEEDISESDSEENGTWSTDEEPSVDHIE
ncbi:hypothetical protein PMAYCL1PPCAC_08961, partial [Pristionchus mayeri]